MSKKDDALKLALEALENLQGLCTDAEDGWVEAVTIWTPEAITAIREALADSALDRMAENERELGIQMQPAQPIKQGWDVDTLLNKPKQPAQQEPVAWNVIDPFGKIVAIEKDAIRGWARIQGYKPTVESLLGFQEQGWRVVPTSPPASKPWVGLTDEERNAIGRHHAYVDNIIRATEAKLKEKNT